MSAAEIKFDFSQFNAAFQAFGEKATKAMGAALYQEGNEIIASCVAKHVPVDMGPLASSGYTELPAIKGGDVSVTVGFGGTAAPYAAAVHENPRAGKTGGRSPSGRPYKHWAKVGHWKYLETSINEAASDFTSRVGVKFWDGIAQAMG